jgi:hypothetical protein
LFQLARVSPRRSERSGHARPRAPLDAHRYLKLPQHPVRVALRVAVNVSVDERAQVAERAHQSERVTLRRV